MPDVKLSLSLTEMIERAKRSIEEWPPAVRIAMGLERSHNHYYETFFVTLSRNALAEVETGLRNVVLESWDDAVRQEVEVLANKIRARIQHIDAGDLQAPGSFA